MITQRTSWRIACVLAAFVALSAAWCGELRVEARSSASAAISSVQKTRLRHRRQRTYRRTGAATSTQPDTTTHVPPADGTVGPSSNSNAPVVIGTRDIDSAAPTSDTAAPQADRKVIRGGVLNGNAISKPAPPYPAIAKAAGAQGTVTVQIVINEEGTVISARAVSGHPLLQQAAVSAAREARFTPTMLNGEPVKVSGVMTYNFVLQ